MPYGVCSTRCFRAASNDAPFCCMASGDIFPGRVDLRHLCQKSTSSGRRQRKTNEEELRSTASLVIAGGTYLGRATDPTAICNYLIHKVCTASSTRRGASLYPLSIIVRVLRIPPPPRTLYYHTINTIISSCSGSQILVLIVIVELYKYTALSDVTVLSYLVTLSS